MRESVSYSLESLVEFIVQRSILKLRNELKVERV